MIIPKKSRQSINNSVFSDDFPLWPTHKFGFAFNNSPWPLAMTSTAPAELKRRVAAAFISYFMRLKSVDYTRKTYSDKFDYDDGRSGRLDLVIIEQIKMSMEALSESILRVSEVEDKRLGETIGEWTIFRAPFGMEVLIDCSNRGALFESLTIARMLLEQLAWSIAAVFEKDDERVSKISAQSSMRFLKIAVPASGRFYGWLSEHAHWGYDAHIKGITVEEGRLGHVFASSGFKAVAMSAALVLSSIYLSAMDQLMKSSPDAEVRAHTLRQKMGDAKNDIEALVRRVVELQPDNGDLVSLGAIIT